MAWSRPATIGIPHPPGAIQSTLVTDLLWAFLVAAVTILSAVVILLLIGLYRGQGRGLKTYGGATAERDSRSHCGRSDQQPRAPEPMDHEPAEDRSPLRNADLGVNRNQAEDIAAFPHQVADENRKLNPE